MNKSDRHAAIRERAADAIRDLYHNATPSYPRDVPDHLQDYFESWFSDAARFEIDYISDGGAYGRDYAKTLRATCNAGRYHSQAARDYYVRKGMHDMRLEHARCNKLDSRSNLTNAAWERITEFGKLYTYGRGGRTLAPDLLVRERGGSQFGMREDYADDISIADACDLIRIVESFNAYVDAWCKSVPEQWREEVSNMDASLLEEEACED